ncbi:MAG TPA: glucosidase [Phycisphaeraceae bacterium]
MDECRGDPCRSGTHDPEHAGTVRMPSSQPQRRRRRNAEVIRLEQAEARRMNWKRWGPYLAERQWGTVREDYSPDGACWSYFPHEHAPSRVYRWGEDGLLGICDRECRLCFALALWNDRDPILKERLFGLANPQGNHGEDVKELYFYLDSSPTHAYLKGLYKYPQAAFPYEQLIAQNAQRSRQEPEYEIVDTGVFDEHRYFDVVAEYAKARPNDILIRITLINRGPEAAPLHVLPTLWFRNTWSWGREGDEGHWPRPRIWRTDSDQVRTQHASLGEFNLVAGMSSDAVEPVWLFTENETNTQLLFGAPNRTPYVKDAFHRRVIHGQEDAVNPAHEGTKAAAWYRLHIPAGGQVTLKLRLFASNEAPRYALGREFDRIFQNRLRETDEFYDAMCPSGLGTQERLIARQAHAGLLWSKQFYHYVVEQWLEGDPAQPPPPAQRKRGRNADWRHLFNRDVLSVPDKWEYPWYAAWDLAFHTIPLARLDPEFAKRQLVLLLREWYMHPNGQIPAYEFNFSDVNPPVHAWACWRVYKISAPRGKRDRIFLERTFQKLLLNFTWWVNRKDREGKHIFSGGFLGLDNIGVFDRSNLLIHGARLEQADATAWMAFFCGTMLAMALELAEPGNAYEDLASKFFEHYIHIADAINHLGGTGLWDEQDGFYYDQLHVNGEAIRLRIRSLVGLIPLIAVEVIEQDTLNRLPGFKKRTDWFIRHRPDLARLITYMEPRNGEHGRYLLAIPAFQQLQRVLRYMLDENELLSPFGIRSLSRFHREHPFILRLNGDEHCVGYEPGESQTGLFGGNSNWRGPVWFPINYLLIEALERYHHFYGNDLRIECPTGSGRLLNLSQIADLLRQRLVALFLPDERGQRPALAHHPILQNDPACRDLILFHEYFHGENGQGLGASHQTGWTALVARCIQDPSER